jgi:endo-1,4-beta-xylanase
MKQKKVRLFLALLICLALALPVLSAEAATTITSNQTGTQDGYYYELWKDSGTTSMTLNSGGAFSATWSNINNALFRKGKKFDRTQTYQQIGNISVNYSANYQPNGNSYLCVYGWTVDPLVEYYIVDSWGSWRPPGATSKGTFTVDGGTYDIYETTRTNQPSIIGNATFEQYWSVRTSKRTSGTISVSEHFKKWESLGMRMGKFDEVSLTVEGYQSSGSADVTTNVLTIGGGGTTNPTPTPTPTPTISPTPTPTPTPGNGTRVEAENMTKSGQYTGNISSPFNGVALYANNDLVRFTQNFTSGTHSFSLRGASNNSNMARVDLLIGGQYKGTFYYGDSNPAVYTINNVTHGTGNQEIQLVVTADNGSWDAYLDYLEIK